MNVKTAVRKLQYLMEKLRRVCLQPPHAEHARPMDDEDACDDGRAG